MGMAPCSYCLPLVWRNAIVLLLFLASACSNGNVNFGLTSCQSLYPDHCHCCHLYHHKRLCWKIWNNYYFLYSDWINVIQKKMFGWIFSLYVDFFSFFFSIGEDKRLAIYCLCQFWSATDWISAACFASDLVRYTLWCSML